MATQYAFGKIVTDGLVLCLDAADRNSYVSGSTTWFNLAGSNNGTLTNGPTFSTGSGGNIVFDGVNDCANLAPSILNTPWSLCSIIRPTAVGYRALYSQDGLMLWVGTNPASGVLVHTNNSARLETSANALTLNQPQFLGISSSPTTLTVFVNSIKYSVTPGLNPTTANTGSLASYFDKTKDFYSGDIFNFSMYNRALSDAELIQNYNAQKSRFGL